MNKRSIWFQKWSNAPLTLCEFFIFSIQDISIHIRIGNFNLKIDKPINEYGGGYLYFGNKSYIALPVAIIIHGDNK
ncbi:hypothetical protein NQZ71_10635 [Niallia taxi]|uniref:hypothetical protein n=1 Tax=Niallia taxi TaxID=2499688 RepID=UPI0011A27472|nr:hypothetical protein [Niallia taxi]MCT2346404.1 hypothetical protein [Niallia taxi]MDE5053363.1 hypothetical protein [Niallia taxi]MED3963347.1 hypothetical protein [Niallia taxi]WOD61286.1 hypothetical protein NQZ71_10635 [Niallia taxi]